jgi:hypothetical protein
MYRRSTGRAALDWNIDWSAIIEWLMENIIPILKLMLRIAPFLI